MNEKLNDVKSMKNTLDRFLAVYRKEAEEGLNKNLAPNEENTDETSGQGEAGKAMSADVKAAIPAGTDVGGATTSAGDVTGDKVVNPESPTKTESPEEDMAVLEQNNPALKKACAAQLRFEAAVMNMIDNLFEQEAAKTASAPMTTLSVEEAAKAWHDAHVDQLVNAFGVSPKVANEMLEEIAETDPAALLPPEALSEDDADAILAAAAEADAAEAGEAEAGEAEVTDQDSTEAVADEEAVASLTEAIQELEAEGFSQEEIVGTLMEDAGITPEDLMETVVEDLREQGLSDEEIVDVAETVDQLQAEGFTPEDLAEALQAEG